MKNKELEKKIKDFVDNNEDVQYWAQNASKFMVDYALGVRLLKAFNLKDVEELIVFCRRLSNDQIKHFADAAGVRKVYPKRVNDAIKALGGNIKNKRIGKKTDLEKKYVASCIKKLNK